MPDTTARDALERTIRYRLPRCSEAELRELDARLVELEKKRELLEVGRQVSTAESLIGRGPHYQPIDVRSVPYFIVPPERMKQLLAGAQVKVDAALDDMRTALDAELGGKS